MQRSLLPWYWKRVSATLRYEGFHILLWRTLTWCLSPVGLLDMMTFYRKDLSQPLEEKQSKGDFSVIQTAESDIEKLTAMVARRYGPNMARLWPYKNQTARDILQQRFQQGCQCFVAKADTEFIHYNWIFFHWEAAVMGTVHSRLQKDEAICNDGFTEEAWRGRGVHAAVNNRMLRYLQEAGYRWAFTSAGADNNSSQKALRRLGWEIYGIMLYFIPRGAEKGCILPIKGSLYPSIQ